MRPILINRKVAKTTFQIDNCGNTDNITIELTRVGGDTTITYPAFESDENQATFMWDEAIYTARKGRYQRDYPHRRVKANVRTDSRR